VRHTKYQLWIRYDYTSSVLGNGLDWVGLLSGVR